MAAERTLGEMVRDGEGAYRRQPHATLSDPPTVGNRLDVLAERTQSVVTLSYRLCEVLNLPVPPERAISGDGPGNTVDLVCDRVLGCAEQLQAVEAMLGDVSRQVERLR